MKEGQQSIYIITGDDLETLKKSPQLEGFKAKGVEVLLLADAIDDFWTWMIGEYQGYQIKSVTRGAAELDDIKSGKEDEQSDSDDKQEDQPDDSQVGTLVAFLKTALEDEVKDVRSTQRLTDSACCLVADEGDMDIHLERMLRQHGQTVPTNKRILEINPKHPLIQRLAERSSQGGQQASHGGANGGGDPMTDAAWLLLDQARIVEGETPSDPAAFARRMSQLVAKGLAA
jgi:molecular chaperone HtpG